ncbi:hypothetical protein ICW40_07180 [Actinotalea ferrariae]|uniref:hypothetical protein n=1 Tax=Actinotalea ferrariae TaxID=1386098 RepID=UPI001C8BAF2A|nr:hypothetical protein [Actinotalea ferrariae]MBX9244590.1 hypothetical protein [Actinotalea ferrariae]
MTSSADGPRGGAGGGRQDWPFGPVTGDPAGAPGSQAAGRPGIGTGSTSERSQTGRAPHEGSGGTGARTPDEPPAAQRRPPLWVLIGAAVLVVGGVVAGVLLLGDRGGNQTVPEADVVTLPVPTPTVEPIAHEGGTAFAAALPATVLAHALSEAGEHLPLLSAGALEGYRHVYTDGATSVTLLAGQWETPEEASARYTAMVQEQTAAVAAAGGSDAGDGAEEAEGDAASTDTTEGPVTTVDGTETGRYTLVPRTDGTGTLTWWNGTAVLQLDGPTEELLDLFTAFPL